MNRTNPRSASMDLAKCLDFTSDFYELNHYLLVIPVSLLSQNQAGLVQHKLGMVGMAKVANSKPG